MIKLYIFVSCSLHNDISKPIWSGLKQDKKGLNPLQNRPSNFETPDSKTLRVFVFVGGFLFLFYTSLMGFIYFPKKVTATESCTSFLSRSVFPDTERCRND